MRVSMSGVTNKGGSLNVNVHNVHHGVAYTNYTKPVLATSTIIRGAIAGRVAMDIQNKDLVQTLNLRLDAGGLNQALSIEVPPGERYRMPTPCPTAAIHGWSSSGTITVAVAEGVVT
jgi:hypothetical protein